MGCPSSSVWRGSDSITPHRGEKGHRICYLNQAYVDRVDQDGTPLNSIQSLPNVTFSILPGSTFFIESRYSPVELDYRVGKVTKADPQPAPYMPLKCYWGEHNRQAFRIAPLYRGQNRTEDINTPALLYYHGTLQPHAEGTRIDVHVRWSRSLYGFALSWYMICLSTVVMLIIALRQTAELGQYSHEMLLLAILPIMMCLLMYLPLFAYIRHHSEQQYQYLTALFQQETIPKYTI